MDWPSFLRGVCDMGIAIYTTALIVWLLTKPANPRSRAVKALSYPINEGTYYRSGK